MASPPEAAWDGAPGKLHQEHRFAQRPFREEAALGVCAPPLDPDVAC